jgi:hypothetical protein
MARREHPRADVDEKGFMLISNSRENFSGTKTIYGYC